MRIQRMIRSVTRFALLAGTILGLTGCVYRRDVVYAQPGPPPPEVVAEPAPPPPPVVDEVVTVAPGPGFVWIGGAYEWVGGRWAWYGGHWAHPAYPRAVWVPGGWHGERHGRVWVRGHWH
jgi:hypothetical protein